MSVEQSHTAAGAAVRRRRRIPDLVVRVGRSLRLTAALAAMHVAAICVALTAPWHGYFASTAAVVLLSHAAWIIRRHALLRDPSSIVTVRISGDDDCAIERRDAERIRGRIDGSSFVLPWMIVLRVFEPGRLRLRSVAILDDAVHEDEFRRLRTRLRWSHIDASRRPLTRAWL